MIAQDEERIHRTLNDLLRLSISQPHSTNTEPYPQEDILNDNGMMAMVQRLTQKNHGTHPGPTTSSTSHRPNYRSSSSFSSSTIKAFVNNKLLTVLVDTGAAIYLLFMRQH
jgi:hypothetical protein